MTRLEAFAVLCLFSGTALLLSTLRSFNREPRHLRVAPFVRQRNTPGDQPGSLDRGAGSLTGRVSMVAAVLTPLAVSAGDALGRSTGIRSGTRERLAAAGRAETASQFRLGQFTIALVTFLGAVAAAVALRPSLAVTLALVVGTPLVAALVTEHRLEREVEARRERLEAELPIVAEQLAVLLAAGMSLGTALDRIAERGSGVAAAELEAIQRQVRRGAPESSALRDWATRARSDAVDRLVGVLAMHREAADIGELLAIEARSMRDAAHRGLVEAIERRAQLVWVPVTVATLVPGLILIGVPFVSAMARITG